MGFSMGLGIMGLSWGSGMFRGLVLATLTHLLEKVS